ncbi:MAG: phosphoglucosamine mutase [Planctomycetota bacterium]
MAQLIISVSGLRGIVGESLTPLVAAQYTAAFAAGLPVKGSVVLTRDGRATGSLFAQTIASTLQASGLDVLYGDAAATPTTGVLVREHQACAGIQISASHHPPPYNGIKLFGADGRVIPAAAGERVIEHYHARNVRWVAHDQIGRFHPLSDTTSAHLAKVLATVDVATIRRRKFRVVLDSNHGAGAVLGERLLRELGCDVTLLGPSPDGLFEHPPEPTADNLRSTAERAVKLAADAVFCQDPDADRLALIDENGHYIGEEFTVAIVLDHRLATSKQQGIVVTNCSTSRMAADICQSHGSRLVLSAVGEANVTDRMLLDQAVYGGEGNGGPIDPRVGYVRDSFVGMAQVLDCMARLNLPLSQLAARLPQYAIHKTTIAIGRDRIAGLLNRLRDHFADATPSNLDGLRLDWPDSWLLVRASNTEPIVRAVAEAKSADRARELCAATARLAAE